MRSRDLDALARGPLPRDRVAVPAHGTPCPRCHRPAGYMACLLCRPDLVPARYGGRLVDSLEDAALVAALLPPRRRTPRAPALVVPAGSR
jgi:hypothetical protein